MVERAQHAANRFFADHARRVGDGLVGQRQRVAHAAVSRARQQTQGLYFKSYLLVGEHMFEVADNMRRRHLLQIELQAARQDGHRNFLRIGGGQNEFHMRGRLFQRFQHRVEGMVGQHVHFVDHIDLEARIDRRIDGALKQRRHFIDTAVRRRIHFDIVDKTAFVDFAAGLALPAWI